MTHSTRIRIAGLGAAAALAAGAALAQDLAGESAAETDPPFGGAANVAYADALWTALEEARLVGPDAVLATPYAGQEPHGAILVTLERAVALAGHEGVALVKRNYLGDGLDRMAVANAPDENLDSVTVMYRREAGYDPDNGDWFWAKFNPDGSLQDNAQGMALAGRVAKGADQGCIACHAAAPGGDYVYTHDRLAE